MGTNVMTKIFTSNDLLKSMGLKVGDKVIFKQDEYEVVDTYNLEYLSRIDLILDKFIELTDLLDLEYKIIQPKPTLTDDEKVILRKEKWYKEIYHKTNKDLELTILRICGQEDINSLALCHCIESEWEDEPYSIEELLKE